MIFEIQLDLKQKIKSAGLTYREIANTLHCCPGTVAGKLNGFCSLTDEERRIIEKTIETALKENFEQL